MTRDHRLRARRLALGQSQIEIGYLAGFMSTFPVSQTENGRGTPATMRKVREAIVYLETRRRRIREECRLDRIEAERVEAVLCALPSPEGDAVLVDRLVDLLHNGAGEAFDLLGARCPLALVEIAGERYLDECTPVVETT